MTTSAIQARFKKLANEAGIPPRKAPSALYAALIRDPHVFRHQDDRGIYTVSKLLGHSRVAVTEMYLHCSQKKLEQAMLPDLLGAGVQFLPLGTKT